MQLTNSLDLASPITDSIALYRITHYQYDDNTGLNLLSTQKHHHPESQCYSYCEGYGRVCVSVCVSVRVSMSVCVHPSIQNFLLILVTLANHLLVVNEIQLTQSVTMYKFASFLVTSLYGFFSCKFCSQTTPLPQTTPQLQMSLVDW